MSDEATNRYLQKRIRARDYAVVDARRKLQLKVANRMMTDAFMISSGQNIALSCNDVPIGLEVPSIKIVGKRTFILYPSWTPNLMEKYLLFRLGSTTISRWCPWWIEDFSTSDGPCYRWKFNTTLEIFFFSNQRRVEWQDA